MATIDSIDETDLADRSGNSPLPTLASSGGQLQPPPIGGKSTKSKGRKSPPISSARTEPVGGDAVPSPTPTIAPQDRQSAQKLLSEIGQRFAENRQKSKSKAFELYQRDLAENSGVLVMGGAVTLKELTVLLMDLEGFMKSTLKEGISPATVLAQFLR